MRCSTIERYNHNQLGKRDTMAHSSGGVAPGTNSASKQEFETIIKQNQGYVARIVASFIDDPHEAKDLCMEVFVRVYKALPKYESRGKFRGWLSRITTNICLNELRRRKRSRYVSLDSPLASAPESNERLIDRIASRAPGAQEIVQAQERDRLVWEAINHLPQKQKMVTVLWMEGGLSYKEIAEFAGCTAKAVERRLSRARLALKKELAHLFPF